MVDAREECLGCRPLWYHGLCVLFVQVPAKTQWLLESEWRRKQNWELVLRAAMTDGLYLAYVFERKGEA